MRSKQARFEGCKIHKDKGIHHRGCCDSHNIAQILKNMF